MSLPRSDTTPGELASALQRDVDDVLLMLWDADISYVKGAHSVIRPEHRLRARKACGLAGPKELTSVGYWRETLGMPEAEFASYAKGLGIHIGLNARRLPKGALAKLQKANPTQTRTLDAEPTPKQSSAAPVALPWIERGHTRKQLQHLSADDIIRVHWAIADDFASSPDPISPAGVRDEHLLQSAASRPHTGSGDQKKYATVEMAAAALMHSIVHNHAFYNGNKRTGLVAMLSFLDGNGIVLTTSQDELFKWTVRVASHALSRTAYAGDQADVEVLLMTDWILANSRPIDHSQRMVTAGALMRRLNELGCVAERNGTKINVKRLVDTRSRWSISGKTTLKYHVPYMGEGRQISKRHVQDLRRALRLSEEHGVDSAKFFGIDKTPIDTFISKYRKTLTRLAKI